MPADRGGKSVSDGFTGPSLDLHLQDIIGPAWRARGPCMVVNDIDLFDGQPDPADVESAFCGIALHELAHILLRPAPFKPRPDTEPAKIMFESLVVGHAVATDPPAAPDAKPFAGHEAGFIRVALHLRHRADLAGTLVPMFYCCAGTHYGLSHPNRYREALGDEPDRLAGLNIRDIIATPYPEAFWRLWTTDVARWHSGCFQEPRKESHTMPIATLIERIAGKQRERRAVRLADFRDVVVQIADGKESDADFVAEALRDADKTVDDLQKAVELLQHRRELRKQWDGVPGLTPQRQKVERQIVQADREQETAESKHYTTVNPLYAELQRLKEAEQEGEKAKRELLATCTDQNLLDKLADVQLRLSKRREEADNERKRIANWRDWAKSECAAAKRQKMIIDGDGDAQVKVHLGRAKEHERKVVEREGMLAKTNKIVSDLEREEASIREQMLVP